MYELVRGSESSNECWPENWQVFLVFASMETQWTRSRGRVTGLKYEAIPMVLDEFGIKKKMRAEVIAALRIMEREALEIFNHV